MIWKKTWKFAAAIFLIITLFTAYWLYHNRSEAVYQRIINQDGYSLSLVKEGVSAEFFLQPEWIPKEIGEKTTLNRVIAKKFDSDIILDEIVKRENDFYIQLDIRPHPNKSSGQLLSTSLITKGSVLNSSGFEWQVTDTSGKDILGDSYGAGEGPGNLTSININNTELEKFRNGANIRYTGYYLYGYQQLNGMSSSIWLPLLFTILVTGGLIVLYRKRSEPENNLVWKLIGHVLIGGFTFGVNHVRLPIGFAIYLLCFRKPRPNHSIKHKAALLGLLMYILQLTVPPIVNHYNSVPNHTVLRHVSIEELGLEGVWKMVAARATISDQARILGFETILTANEEIKELEFQLVDVDNEGRYLHTTAVYQSSDQSVELKRSSTREWLQFSRQLLADYFFVQVQSLQLMKLKPTGGDHQYVKLELMEDGQQWSYAVKGENNFGVDEKGVYPIFDEQLPVTANHMMVCAPQSLNPTSYCEDTAQYYFRIVAGGARE